MESVICAQHKSVIDQGERWVYQAAETSGGRLLMGRDLPPQVVDAKVRSGFLSSQSATRHFTFTVEKHDGSQSEVEFDLSHRLADGIFRALSRDRAGAASMAHDGTELMAAIGRMVVNAAELEYAVAELAATSEGLRDAECHERAAKIVRKTGEAMRRFRHLAAERSDLRWLMDDTATMLEARHFVTHAVRQREAVAEERPALFILSPRQGETMITTAQALNNAELIKKGIGRVREASAAMLRDENGRA